MADGHQKLQMQACHEGLDENFIKACRASLIRAACRCPRLMGIISLVDMGGRDDDDLLSNGIGNGCIKSPIQEGGPDMAKRVGKTCFLLDLDPAERRHKETYDGYLNNAFKVRWRWGPNRPRHSV